MNQLTQELKSGKMEIIDVPIPALNRGQILVRNYFSLISAGTEGKTVSDARKNYFEKARGRQKELQQVIELIRKDGFKDTYRIVMNKLEALSPLGYSSSGEVIAIGEGVRGFKAGDLVSCGGNTASHAEIISVPENLCVSIPKNVDMRYAAFTTIASIAIQGIRQAELGFGGNCVVIGLGLVGQLTALILQSTGIKAICIDINERKIIEANKAGIELAFSRNSEGLEDNINRLTKGYGADAVIIAAGTDSIDPVEFAGCISRIKGKVIIVGAVPTGFSRSNYYKKELDLRMSSSYGPGRYDPQYEDKGIDYPIGYVRFTEKRNMESFLHLLESRILDISNLISHEFELPNAPEAYNMVLKQSESFTGILIKYKKDSRLTSRIDLPTRPRKDTHVKVGFIGAGSFAQNILLPKMKGQVDFRGIVSGHGNNSTYVGKKYEFSFASSNPDDILKDPNCNTVFIVTRHNLHAKYTLAALKSGKHVFVEKPLALLENELEEFNTLKFKDSSPILMVGYNRRFSKAVLHISAAFNSQQSKAINIRINAGQTNESHWVNDPDIGGGRIIGEFCHFIDLAMYLAGAKIISIHADSMKDHGDLNDTIVTNLRFTNGSVATISYFTNGTNNLTKEYVEVFCGGNVAIIDDFKSVSFHGTNNRRFKFKKQDKGHDEEIKQFISAIKNGSSSPIPFEEILHVSKAAFNVIKSVKENRKIFMST